MIYTHVSPDLDAISSVWAVKRFIPRFANDSVTYVSANWNGAEMADPDIAVDIEAGGRGIKGEKDADGRPHSCFAAMVKRYAPAEDQIAIKHLAAYIDAHDSYGSAIRHLAPEIEITTAETLHAVSLVSIYSIIHKKYPSDCVDIMSTIFDGLLEKGRNRLRAEAEADLAKILPSGKVALTRNIDRNHPVNYKLFERGVRAVVYRFDYNIGIFRRNGDAIRMDHPDIKAVAEKAREASEWFSHPNGFLYCRGSRKAPSTTPSKVDPMDLARAAEKALESS